MVFSSQARPRAFTTLHQHRRQFGVLCDYFFCLQEIPLLSTGGARNVPRHTNPRNDHMLKVIGSQLGAATVPLVSLNLANCPLCRGLIARMPVKPPAIARMAAPFLHHPPGWQGHTVFRGWWSTVHDIACAACATH